MISTLPSPAATLAPNREFSRLASDEQVERTAEALTANGFRTVVVESAAQARALIRKMLPAGADVYDPPSLTVQQIGLGADLETDTTFRRVRERLHDIPRGSLEYRRLVAGPDVVIGSIHAITEQGQVLLASATGSQIASASFGAATVIWVVGTQKIVATLEEGFRRIREYSYPLEDDRTRKTYGQPSAINKILVANSAYPGRITVVLVKENLGF